MSTSWLATTPGKRLVTPRRMTAGAETAVCCSADVTALIADLLANVDCSGGRYGSGHPRKSMGPRRRAVPPRAQRSGDQELGTVISPLMIFCLKSSSLDLMSSTLPPLVE